ncbi:MAG TPA: hypothetical protein VFS10_17850 [Pyrinomonadaceae bacterium]|nr:hypothetical protein [Pyrinomonadaceae bacterium]
MKNTRALFLSALIALFGAASAFGQATDPGITANGVIGEVVAVDAGAKQIFVKTDAGSVVTVAVADNTLYKKLPPGETTLNKATDITFAALSAGDRVFARGAASEDRKTVTARMVIAMTKTDLAQKHEAERAEWSRRGIVGVVTALNPAAKEITIQPLGGRGGPQGQQPQGAQAASQTPAQPSGAQGGPQAGGPPAPPAPVVVAAGAPSVKFRRYTADSVKFSDAKASTFEELKVGDQLRALGERSADGTRFTPEEVVSGAFRTLLGTITAIDAEKRELQIKTMPGDQPMTVVVSKDSDVKQVPAEFAQMMGGGRPGGGGAPGAGAPGAGGGGGGGARPAGGGDGPGGGGPRRMGGGMQEMLERVPPATFEQLKQGTMIVFSTTGGDPARVTAIQLIAGIDPIVQMMQARAAAQGRPVNLGSFNLGIGQP